MKSLGGDIDLTDDDDTVSKIEITEALLRKKELANSDVLEVVNRITSQSAACHHKIPLLTIYIHGTPLHTRHQYIEKRNNY